MANNCKGVDYWRWAPEVDVISNDNYLITERTDSYLDLAMSADLTRSLASGGPWLLMEHSTSAVSWQPRNVAKRPGEMRRNSLSHLARGADGLLFFQWRASRFGGEKHHSAMLPHGGTDTRIWREVTELGAELADLADLRGSRVEPDIALIWDWEAWWALELEWRPSRDLDYLERVRAWYEAAWRAGLTVDFEHRLDAFDRVVGHQGDPGAGPERVVVGRLVAEPAALPVHHDRPGQGALAQHQPGPRPAERLVAGDLHDRDPPGLAHVAQRRPGRHRRAPPRARGRSARATATPGRPGPPRGCPGPRPPPGAG
jgi:hypothetical protein